ncbi:unnamed protein product [Adineta steineri]|uniref:Uncharacterized protein n=1 Tax=Adineta steineri TaxID=433720 RepID=A0A818I146_9BILA|nr:unnamed protein product [Adineta steineri]CAF3517123.1 unnamed protein product [Adineta steineri]
MQTSINTVDYDNLNIITHPPPPRRRQSGISLIPYRPYVKSLSSVRQPFSHTNGIGEWEVMGKDEIYFTQSNARCIGSLLSDCHISDTIRWDIEGESTRLPLMCKLWMIVDGAVVERGKPHLVQDAAIQVYTAGRNLRTIITAQKRHDETSSTTTKKFDRHRRQSWHELNEYHSVSYYQYTRPVRAEFQASIQCDLDNEYFTSKQEILHNTNEQIIHENDINDFHYENARETVHNISIPQERAQISITTQTESPFKNQSTSIDYQFIRMFNLNLETNQILLSSIVNPYYHASTSNDFSDIIIFFRHGKQYKHQSTSTGDDYPHWWLRLTTDLILADFITNQGEEKEKSILPPSPRHDQSIQTEVEKSRPSSARSSSISTHFELINDIDDENNPQRFYPFSDNSQRIDSRSSDNQSVRSYGNHVKQRTSSKQSEAEYNLWVTSLNQQQHASTPDILSNRTGRYSSSNDTTQIQIKNSENTTATTTVLASLLERYEKSLRERQRAFTIINDQLLDIDDVLKHYKDKIKNSEQSNTTMEFYRDMSDRSLSTTITNIIRDKYRKMPEITSEEMIQGYIPSPRIYITSSTIVSPRERQSHRLTLPDYCSLCLTDYNGSSAWIKYNERRIEQLQKRIDLMLQIDDNEEAELLLSSSPRYSTVATVSQRIDDILMKKPRSHRSLILDRHDRTTVSPHRYDYRLPYRLNQSLPATPRQLSRNGTRSTTPVSKSVRISTRSVPPTPRTHQSSSSTSRPIVSILRRSSVPSKPRPLKLAEPTHVWRSKADGKLYSLKPFSIPRYYRLYNDAGFKEMYDFSRVHDTYSVPDRTNTDDYSSLLTNFVLEHQLPSPIRSVA